MVSETKRASGLLKAGEEGNLHRPLVEVGVDQADLQSMPIPSEKKDARRQRRSVPNREKSTR